MIPHRAWCKFLEDNIDPHSTGPKFIENCNDTHSSGRKSEEDFNDPHNKDLVDCTLRYNVQSIYEKYCDKVSLADFVVITAEAILSRLESHYDSTNPFKDGTMA